MKDEITKLLNKKILSSAIRIIKNNQEMMEYLNEKWKFSEGSIKDKIYYFQYGISPICKYGNQMKIVTYTDGWICSKTCQCSIDKKNETMISKYGKPHALQIDSIKKKQENTLLDRYGSTKLIEVSVEKRIETNLKRYGTKTVLENKEVHDKTRGSYKNKTGYESVFHNPEVQKNIQDYFMSVNGKKSFIKQKEENFDTCVRLFGENSKYLTDPNLLSNLLENMSRQEISDMIGCSVSLIDKRISEFDLTKFMGEPSSYEVLIESFLNELDINFIRNDRTLLKPKEVDFLLPDHNIAIEFNGLHWHTESKGKDASYHLGKTEKCLSKNVRLLHIFQNEWDSKSDIVKDIIKKSVGITNRIYARRCEIREVSFNDSKKFLDDNHIQGNKIGSKFRYGLYYDNEIYSIMTFSKKDGFYELDRFANKLGVTVIGGAGKLLKEFVTKESPKKILSYSDRRYFSGKVYESLGFVNSGNTKVNFHYVKGGKLYPRQQFQKHKIDDGSGRTGDQIMKANGYDIIYDCGHSRWILDL